jgi:AraC-like DNA-binding protein
MGRSSITGGVMPAGSDRIQFDLHINGRRLRPTLPWAPTEENLQRARVHRKMLKARIAAGTFRLAEEFPDYVRRHVKSMPLALTFCRAGGLRCVPLLQRTAPVGTDWAGRERLRPSQWCPLDYQGAGEGGVAEIAEGVGYSSASTFSVAFTRHVGRPPTQYAREQTAAAQASS